MTRRLGDDGDHLRHGGLRCLGDRRHSAALWVGGWRRVSTVHLRGDERSMPGVAVLLVASDGFTAVLRFSLTFAIAGWPLSWKTWKSQGIPKWSGKS